MILASPPLNFLPLGRMPSDVSRLTRAMSYLNGDLYGCTLIGTCSSSWPLLVIILSAQFADGACSLRGDWRLEGKIMQAGSDCEGTTIAP